MERFLIEYLVNSLWQIPLLAAGAWLALRVVRPGPTAQHRVWVGVLPLMLAMPLLTPHARTTARVVLPPTQSPAPIATPVLDAAPATIPPPATISTKQSAEPSVTPTEPPPETAPTPSASTSHNFWPPMRTLELSPTATHWLLALYLAGIALMAARLLCSWWLAARLAARATPATLNDAASELLDRCSQRLALDRPRVLISTQTHSPMVIGVLQPSLLLPEAVAGRLQTLAAGSAREFEAVFLHELAHLRRRDCLANLVCSIAALPVAYHPATFFVQQRIRRTREMVCDAMAAAAMQSPLGYARCLVSLAREMQDGISPVPVPAVGMFDDGVMEERVMQLIKVKPTGNVWMRTIRLAGGAALVLAALATPAIFHVTPTLAQTASPVITADAPALAATSTPAVAPEPANQPQAAAQPTPAAPTAPAKRAEAAQQPTEPTSAEAQSPATNPDLNRQLEEARRRLDENARVYNSLLAQQGGASPEQLQNAALAEINRKVAEAQATIATAQVNSAEFKAQIAYLNSAEFKKQWEDAAARFNSPEYKERMAKLSQQIAEAKVNSDEFKAQMQKLNSPEFKRQLADMQAKFNSPEFKRQMAEAQAKFNSPEFKEQMERLNRYPELMKQSDLLDGEYRKDMEEVRRLVDEALKAWPAPAATQAAPSK